MKILYFILLATCVLFAFHQPSPSNTVTRITYKVHQNKSAEEHAEQQEKLKERIPNEALRQLAMNMIYDMEDEMSNISYELLYNKQKSLYQISNTSVGKTQSFKIAKSIFGGDDLYYKNISNGEKIRQTQSNDKLFNVSSPINEYEWIVSKESKEIQGYTCYKASTSFLYQSRKGTETTNVTAWFTDDIPFPFGPQGFDGLPGLVLEVTISDNLFLRVDTIEQNYPKKKIKLKSDGIPISKEDFQKKMNTKMQAISIRH